MEGVDPHVEAAVLWLAQTILEVLFAGETEAWIRRVGLADDTERFKSEVEMVEAVVGAAKGRAAGNRPLARSLARLKELLYDADGLVDELDYYRLQHQVEGGTIAWDCDDQPQGTDVNGGAQLVDGSRDNSGIPNRNDRKKRSKAWEEFSITEKDADGKPVKAVCIHCGTQVKCETWKGTSVLHNHLKSNSCKRKRAAIEQTPNPSSADDGAQNGATISTHDSDRRKRMRSDEVLAHNTAASTDLWDKAEICNRIQQTIHQLQKAISEVQKLCGSGSVASSHLCQNKVADSCRRTSSLLQHKMYGRVDEMNSIIKHMTEYKPAGAIVLPIVGIGGIGKTALGQVLYNDPIVESQFHHRIWIWVSNNFDEMRLTVEMLDFVSQEKHEGISSLAKLQEILVSHVTSKRTLLILDDVWDDIDVCRWNKLLAPLRSDNTKGNVILLTTRKLSVAKRVGTVKHINLGRLEDDDFWLFFKACAFGDENYKEHPSLTIIGQQIANNLQGNPLAAQTAGMLLREHLTTDHWGSILKDEKWKSLQLNGGIMSSLKLSFDELPYYLQQCFLYCSLFPKNHQFLSNELVCLWISQGFVKVCHSTKRLEEVGQNYFTDLLNSGFFQQVETEDRTLGDQTLYVMPALMHDFARLVSGTECAAIDDLPCREVPPTIRHLSILTYSAYPEDKYGNIPRNEKFEEKLRRIVNSMRNLRSLVLIGKYDHFFCQSLQGIFQKAQNLRALQISEAHADFGYSVFSLVNSTHVRYIKLGAKFFPGDLSKFYHLQVLDMGFDIDSTVPNGINNLISLRHLVASKAVYSSIGNIGKMTSLQELHDFNCATFEIAQLQSLSELTQLGVSQLENVVTREEACGAKLREKSHLEKLHLSWEDTLSEDEYDIDMSSEPSFDAVEIGTSKEVLEGLEPHLNLKHLQISGYPSSTSPDWLVKTVSVTCLQTLHLEDCRELQVLPSLERLPFLTKLKLRNMWKVRRVTVPALEELVLIEMPKLERCSCNSVRDLNSSLRVLTIEGCLVLEAFPLFESCEKLKIEQKSRLPSLSVLTIRDCPQLIASILRFCENLFSSDVVAEYAGGDMADAGSVALPSLEHLKIKSCGITGKWLSVMLQHAPALEELSVDQCHQISGLLIEGTGRSLSNQTCTPQHSSAGNPDGTLTSAAPEGLVRIPSRTAALEGNLTCLKKLVLNDNSRLESLQLYSCTALEELTVAFCRARVSLEGNFTSLRILKLWHNPELESLQLYSCTALEELTVAFCIALVSLEGNFTSLKKLALRNNSRLVSLQLYSCTALEHLSIKYCESLDMLEGFRSLRGLRYLDAFGCPGLPPYLEHPLSQGYELCAGLESLRTDDLSFLTTSFCKCFTSLQCLEFYECTTQEVRRLTDEQERALQLLTSTQELRFENCYHLEDLPVGLHSLPSLKKLVIFYCKRISRLPEKGLPPSLEELDIRFCSTELTDACRTLAAARSKQGSELIGTM